MEIDAADARGSDAVLKKRFAPTHLQKCQFTTFLVQFLEAVKAIPAVPCLILQALETFPSCLPSSSNPTFAQIIFCSLVIGCPQNFCRRWQGLSPASGINL